MQVCTSLQTDNHANTSPLSYLQAGCPSCRPTNSVKALFIIVQNYIISTRFLFCRFLPTSATILLLRVEQSVWCVCVSGQSLLN